MPIYEFECEECKRTVEHFVTSTEAKTLTFLECGKCGGRMKKLISAPNFKVEGYNADNSYSKEKPKKPKNVDRS